MINQFIDNLILSFVTAFGITFIAVPLVISVAKTKRLFDIPGERASHRRITPTLGGLAIYVGLIFSITFWTDFSQCWHLQHLITATTVIFFTGLYDDIVGLSPFRKSIGQVFAALVIVVWGDLRLTSFYGVLGFEGIPYIISILFSVLTILVIINAFNFIDGINGLASSMGIVAGLAFGVWFYLTGDRYQEAIVAFSLVGALVAFLRFNITPAKIFMGDTGSMLVGMIIAYLSIEFIETNKVAGIKYHIDNAPIVAIGFLMIPLFDLLRVIAIRLWHKRSPFSPDRNHLHHKLLDLGFSHDYSTFFLTFISILLIIFSLVVQEINLYILGFSLLLFMFLFTWVLFMLVRKKNKNLVK
jgi:UDP-GlcNAc:undecaprenyl-phosphate/decaprenyl-phosphate GlcNAc-1-phosphate transferase